MATSENSSVSTLPQTLTKIFENDFRQSLLENECGGIELEYEDVDRIARMGAASFESVFDCNGLQRGGLTPLQNAILLLCENLNISVSANGDGNATFNFHGGMTVDFDTFGALRDRKLIETDYRTGRIRLAKQGGAQ